MMTWRKPHEEHPAHHGPHAPPPHFRHGKPPHEHIYEACEAILANMQEISDRMSAIERQIARAGS